MGGGGGGGGGDEMQKNRGVEAGSKRVREHEAGTVERRENGVLNW